MKPDQPTNRFEDQPTQRDDQRFESPSTPSVDKSGQFDLSFDKMPLDKTEIDKNAGTTHTLRPVPKTIGKYRLLERVGQGGVGSVYRGQSTVDQTIVAVKILKPEIMAKPLAVQRFEKEARMQAEIDSPYVTRLLEFGEQDGVHYIVSEFVDGISLRRLTDKLFQSEKKFSLQIIRDVLRALDAMHSRGVVHRDVKPENVLVMFSGPATPDAFDLNQFIQAKLTDFGLARHIEQSESLDMTQQKAILGTPIYLSPEQYSESRAVDARTDIYSTGATLFHMLAGEPPFNGDSFMELAEMHRSERPRPLNTINPAVDDALSNVVAKALEKHPDMRYAAAGEMLSDIENILRSRPISLRLYPQTPITSSDQVKKYVFSWELDAAAANLWPLVSDTDRFNRALGLPAPEYLFEDGDPATRKTRAKAKFNGMPFRWTEHAFQWIEGREMSVLREFETGPFEWMTSTVELFPLLNQRTRLIHSIAIKPRGLFGRLVTTFQVGWATRRSMNKIYPRIAELANQGSHSIVCDLPYGKPVTLNRQQQDRLDQIARRLGDRFAPRPVVEQLGRYLGTASDSHVSRIRPKPLARCFACTPEEFLNLCLNATREGMLSLMWDLICPVCRIAAETKDSIKAISAHGHCQACRADFKIDFAQTVELIFRVHPQIRKTDARTYCIGGPYHSPHVISQNRLAAGQRVTIESSLNEGAYQICGPQLPENQPFGVKSGALGTHRRFDLLSIVPQPELATGSICIELQNPTDQELLARVERKADYHEATTAAEVSRLPAFEKMFPDQVVSADQLVNLTQATVLMIRFFELESLIEQHGEIRARSIQHSLIESLTSQLAGISITSISEGLQIIGEKTDDAFAAMLLCRQWTSKQGENVQLTFGFALNGGEVLIGGKTETEFFGRMIRVCHQLIQNTTVDALVVTEDFIENEEFSKSAKLHLQTADRLANDQLSDGTKICHFDLSLDSR